MWQINLIHTHFLGGHPIHLSDGCSLKYDYDYKRVNHYDGSPVRYFENLKKRIEIVNMREAAKEVFRRYGDLIIWEDVI